MYGKRRGIFGECQGPISNYLLQDIKVGLTFYQVWLVFLFYGKHRCLVTIFLNARVCDQKGAKYCSAGTVAIEKLTQC